MSDLNHASALGSIRICDFTGQLAGAAATKWMAAFGADVIRIEDLVNQGRWDMLRGLPPYVDERRGIDFGGAFNNHNPGKRGIALDIRQEAGKEILTEIIKQSDVVCENFAAGVLERLGFGWEKLQELNPNIIYVSNCGFGHSGPYKKYKTWGPIVQAVSGLSFHSGRPDMEPAGWGYSFMDHTGGMYQAMAILFAVIHRQRTGEGQWVDMSCTEAGLTLHGPAILDWTVNDRPLRRAGQPNGNRSDWPSMSPHGIFPSQGEDQWISIACRNDQDWQILADAIDEDWALGTRWQTLTGRVEHEDELEAKLTAWTEKHDKFELQRRLQSHKIPSAAVQTPEERIDHDLGTSEWGLWPEVEHSLMGPLCIDGLPVHLSKTDWNMSKGAPCLGEYTDEVLRELLGLKDAELQKLREEKVI